MGLIIGGLGIIFGIVYFHSARTEFKTTSTDPNEIKAVKRQKLSSIRMGITFILCGIIGFLSASGSFSLFPCIMYIIATFLLSSAIGGNKPAVLRIILLVVAIVYIILAMWLNNLFGGGSSSKSRCPSCGEYANLYYRELIDGTNDYKNWCSDCWDSFDDLNIYN